MIYVTKNNADHTRLAINHRKIDKIEDGPKGCSNLFMDNGKVYTVSEQPSEVIHLIQVFESEIIKMSFKSAGRDCHE